MDRKNNRSNLSLLEGNIYIGNIYISFFIHPITPHPPIPPIPPIPLPYFIQNVCTFHEEYGILYISLNITH
jgi:hypothetical protein